MEVTEVRKSTMFFCLLRATLWLKLLWPCSVLLLLLLIFGWWGLTTRLPVWADVPSCINITADHWQIQHYSTSKAKKKNPFKLNGYLVKETCIETGFSQFSFVFICHSQQRHRGAVGIWAPTDQLTAIDLQPVTNYWQILSVSQTICWRHSRSLLKLLTDSLS